jgi:hypothetical protein
MYPLVQALRDMEYMYRLEKVSPDIQRRTQGQLVNAFHTHIPKEGFNTSYLCFPNALASRQPDLLRELMRKYLHHRLTWSAEERAKNQEGYYNKNVPEGYSATVDWLARISVALLAAAWVIVPIVIMTVPFGSKARDLTTLSIAVVLFGASVSWVLKTRNQDTLAATAAYAAVLVVFYGNVVGPGNGNSNRLQTNQTRI